MKIGNGRLREQLELSVVDKDISDIFNEIGSGKWPPGLAVKIQIARSLKSLIEVLRSRSE
ncbi:MAG: hypothetical protein HY739_00685 [Desulfobacterales bacterium]|nr:hypothetical protein [Desulfobacterales bacterium]